MWVQESYHVPPEPIARAPSGKPATQAGFDLLDHLAAFVNSAPPPSLLILGEFGTGKSTLIRSLIPRMKGPGVLIAYRAEVSAGEADVSSSHPPRLSLLLVDPTESRDPTSLPEPAGTDLPAPSEVASPSPGGTLPPAVLDALKRFDPQGPTYLVLDSWDPTSEREFRSAGGEHASVKVVSSGPSLIAELLGRHSVRSIAALPAEPDPSVLSGADGLVRLGWEEVEGFRLRVVTVPKLQRAPVPETRYLYSLDGGTFQCPPQFPPGFRPPIAPPSPDASPSDDSLYPGSQPFADAFGRLRFHGITALEVPSRFPNSVTDVFLYPLVAHVLSIGGRVVWIPTATSTPAQIAIQLSRFLPPAFLAERLRIVSAGAADPGLEELKPVVLPVRREPTPGRGPGSTGAPSGGPLFPEAHHFLRSTPSGRPSLYVIYLDGLSAMAAIAGVAINVQTFPTVVGAYLRLPRFHGFGIGRSEDPLTKALTGSVDTYLHLEERYGRTVLLGVRPRTSPFILDWPDESGRYSLIAVK